MLQKKTDPGTFCLTFSPQNSNLCGSERSRLERSKRNPVAVCLLKLCLALLLAVWPASAGFAAEGDFFSTLIGNDNYNKLLAEGEVTSVFEKGGTLSLAPANGNKAALLGEITAINPVIGVEILLLLEKPGRDFSAPAFLLALYNRLHAISSLGGIEYFSHSRGKMRIFFYKAYVITDAAAKKQLPDPLATAMLPGDKLAAFISDSSFGKYTGQVSYTSTGGFFSMNIVNSSQIYYGLIPAAKPGNLKLYLAVFPYGDKILFYGLTCVNTVNFFGLAEQKVPSFYNRLKAMFNWFENQVQGIPASG